MHDVETWPIDVLSLEKGSNIDAPTIERITGERAGTNRYRLALLQLRTEITRMAMVAHRPLSLAVRGDHLHVNTDAEAALYHDRLADEAETAMRRNLVMLRVAVDRSKLTAEQAQAHDRSVALLAMKVGNMRKVALPATDQPAAIASAAS